MLEHQDTLGDKKKKKLTRQHTKKKLSICPKHLKYQDTEEVHPPHLPLSTLMLIHEKCCSTAPALRGITTRSCLPITRHKVLGSHRWLHICLGILHMDPDTHGSSLSSVGHSPTVLPAIHTPLFYTCWHLQVLPFKGSRCNRGDQQQCSHLQSEAVHPNTLKEDSGVSAGCRRVKHNQAHVLAELLEQLWRDHSL